MCMGRETPFSCGTLTDRQRWMGEGGACAMGQAALVTLTIRGVDFYRFSTLLTSGNMDQA